MRRMIMVASTSLAFISGCRWLEDFTSLAPTSITSGHNGEKTAENMSYSEFSGGAYDSREEQERERKLYLPGYK